MQDRAQRLWAVASATFMAATALAPSADAQALLSVASTMPQKLDQLAEMSLTDLLNTKLTVATGSQLSLAQSPSIVSVIAAEDLTSLGVSSVAEALRLVPGFYDVYDQVSHNVGVRGIHGGPRASGNIIKLMIDGQSVSDISSTGNNFGPELVPLEAVERIEIIRGPGSALYGANAFLGVINIITKSGADHNGAMLRSQIGLTEGNVGYGGGVVVGVGDEHGEALLAVHAMHLDRSGMLLPGTSPNLHRSQPYQGDTVSTADVAQPISVLFRASTGEVERGGQFSALGTFERLDASAEFHDLLPMTHGTRVARTMETYRIGYRMAPIENLVLQASAGLLRSGPTSENALDVRQDEYVLRSTQRGTAWELALQAEGRLLDTVDLKFGIDYRHEYHASFAYDQALTEDILDSTGAVFRSAGTRLPNALYPRDDHEFESLGGFVQAYSRLADLFSMTLGLRFDHHSAYDLHWSPRAALVLAPGDGDSFVKLLYGSSFKAPSAEQLYVQPAVPGDLTGRDMVNQRSEYASGRTLTEQSAHSWEAAAGTWLGGIGHLQANAYATLVLGRALYEPRGDTFIPRNERKEWVVGGESELRVDPSPRLMGRIGLGVAKSVDRTSEKEEGARVRSNQDQPLYPVFQAHIRMSYRIPVLELQISPELSLASARARPQRIPRGDIAAPAYMTLNIAMSRGWQWWGERTAHVSVRASNLTGTDYVEPGHFGFDVPGSGRSILGTLDLDI